MKNLLIFLVILFLGCSKKETENINVYQITVRYKGPQDAPSPIIILTNRKQNVNDSMKVSFETEYQIEKEDLMKIEEICYSEKIEAIKNSLVLVKINKDNKVQRYFFNKKDGVEILDKIKKITSHYNNDRLNADLYDLTNKQNWYNDIGIKKNKILVIKKNKRS